MWIVKFSNNNISGSDTAIGRHVIRQWEETLRSQEHRRQNRQNLESAG